MLINFKAPGLAYANSGNTKEEEGTQYDAFDVRTGRRREYHQEDRRQPGSKTASPKISDFVVGGTVKVVNALGGNVIVNVKESRVAISEEMAKKIMI